MLTCTPEWAYLVLVPTIAVAVILMAIAVLVMVAESRGAWQ